MQRPPIIDQLMLYFSRRAYVFDHIGKIIACCQRLNGKLMTIAFVRRSGSRGNSVKRIDRKGAGIRTWSKSLCEGELDGPSSKTKQWMEGWRRENVHTFWAVAMK